MTFDLQISVNEDVWTVFRRYSRFREMHQSLKLKYPQVGPAPGGPAPWRPRPLTCAPPQLAALEFPPKKLFGNRDERMVAERRLHLEVSPPPRPRPLGPAPPLC